MAKTTDAVELLRSRYVKGIAKRKASLRRERFNANVAQLVYDFRMRQQVTQTELAIAIGTTQPVISRLEDADYQGHSLSMLHRIAEAFGYQVELKLVKRKD